MRCIKTLSGLILFGFIVAVPVAVADGEKDDQPSVCANETTKVGVDKGPDGGARNSDSNPDAGGRGGSGGGGRGFEEGGGRGGGSDRNSGGGGGRGGGDI